MLQTRFQFYVFYVGTPALIAMAGYAAIKTWL